MRPLSSRLTDPLRDSRPPRTPAGGESVKGAPAPLARALEPRMMFDAAGLATAIAVEPVGHEGEAEGQSQPDASEGGSSEGERDIALNDALQATTAEIGSERREIVFIDPAVRDRDSLIAGMNDAVEVVMLSPESGSEGALSQITESLSNRSSIDAIHIIGHGNSGEMKIGGTSVNVNNIERFTHFFSDLGRSLSENGDIFLYGCDIAEGDIGRLFVNKMADVTSADIAASNNDTGSSILGGDWDLEYRIGDIEAHEAVVSQFEGFEYLLASDVNFDSEPTGKSGSSSTNIGDFTFYGNGTANLEIIDGSSSFPPPIVGAAEKALRYDSDFTRDVTIMGFETTDSSNFKMEDLEIYFTQNGETSIFVEGLRNGTVEFSEQIDILSTGTYGSVTFSEDAGFRGTISFTGWDSVDEVRFRSSSSNYIELELDDINVSPEVVTAPTANSATASDTLLSESDVATDALSIDIEFSESMNQGITPTLTFPTVGENPSGALTLSGSSGWLNATTYRFVYTLSDTDLDLSDIDIQVSGAQNGGGQAITDTLFADVFSIDTAAPGQIGRAHV